MRIVDRFGKVIVSYNSTCVESMKFLFNIVTLLFEKKANSHNVFFLFCVHMNMTVTSHGGWGENVNAQGISEHVTISRLVCALCYLDKEMNVTANPGFILFCLCIGSNR